MSNTNKPDLIERIWETATPVLGYDARVYRRDEAGMLMRRDEHGLQTTLGWDVGRKLKPVHWTRTDT